MKLFYREMGLGQPLVILHGLYGSSDNWITVGRELAKEFRVLLFDQRNHGQSPHSSIHNYQLLADDLKEMFDELNISNAIILGHSMGGKAAMLFSSKHPNLVKSLIVVDISPVSYLTVAGFNSQEKVHAQIVAALLSIDVKALSSRQQADDLLSKSIADNRVRQFLLKNLKRDGEGNFSWILNLDSISRCLPDLMDSVLASENQLPIETPTLFIKGELSPYITSEHEKVIKGLFNDYLIINIPNAGHWVHAEQPSLFLEAVNIFLNVRKY